MSKEPDGRRSDDYAARRYSARYAARCSAVSTPTGLTVIDARSDRGNLAEMWYARRYATGAKPHVAYQVKRGSGENEGLVENRVMDLFAGGEAREVKDIEGRIDEEQLGAYLDILRDDKARQQTGIESVRYVFTKPEGAAANLELLADVMKDRDMSNRLRVEIFDASGSTHVISTPEQALVLVPQLKTTQTKQTKP